MSPHASHPLGINTDSKPMEAENRKRPAAASMAGIGLMATPPTLGFFKRIAKIIASKLGLMVFVSVVTQFIIKPDAFWHFLKILCAIIGMAGDDKVRKGVTTLFESGREVVTRHSEPDADGQRKPSLVEQGKGFVKNTGEHIKGGVEKGMEKAKKEAEPLAKKAEVAFDRLGGQSPQMILPPQAVQPPDESQDLPPANAGQPAVLTPAPYGGMGGILASMRPQVAQSPSMLGQFKRGATKFGQSTVDVLQAVEAHRLASADEFQLYRRWWDEHCPYNGRCDRKHPMKVPAHAHGNFACRACGQGSSYPAARIRFNGPPPPPPQKPKQFYTWLDEQRKKEAQQQSEDSQTKDKGAGQ